MSLTNPSHDAASYGRSFMEFRFRDSRDMLTRLSHINNIQDFDRYLARDHLFIPPEDNHKSWLNAVNAAYHVLCQAQYQH